MGFAEEAYLFRHAMMRAAAYELQPPVERGVLHGYAYAIIEELPHEDPDTFAYELAGHARDAALGEPDARRRAEMLEREAHWLSRAMQRARDNSNFRLALECAERTLTNDAAPSEQRHGAALQGAEMSAALGEFGQVPEFLTKAESIPHGQDPTLRAAWILSYVNVALLPQREYERGIELLNEALDIYRAAGDRLGEARAVGYAGNVRARLGDREEAVREYERAEKIFRKLGHQRGLSTCRGNLGLMYRYFDDHAKAEGAYREALAIDREIGNREGVPRHIGNLATLYRDMERYDAALALFDEAGDLFRELGDRAGQMRNALNHATCFERIGQFHRAITLYAQAERIAAECGLALDVADYTYYRGAALLKINDTVRGEPVLEEAALRYEKEGASRHAGETWEMLAQSAFAREEFDAALRNANAAMQNYRAADVAPGFELLALHAEAALASDRLAEAAQSATEALKCPPEGADPVRLATLKAIAKKGQASSAS